MSKKNSSAKRSWLGRLFFGGSKGLADDIEAKRAAKNDVEEIVSPVKQIVRGFMERKLAVGALCVVIAMFLLVFIGPLFMTNYTDTYTEVTQANLPPTMSMLSVPSELKNDIKMLDSYGSFSVGLSNAGKVYVWGATGLGTTGIDIADIPEEVQNEKIAWVAAGIDHIVAVGENGKVYAWGANKLGQYGYFDPAVNPNIAPEPDELLNGTIDASNIKKITCGYQATAILMNDGTLYMWGNKNTYQNFDTVATLDGKLTDIDFTLNYVVAVTDGNSVYTGKRGLYDQMRDNMGSATVPLREFLNGRKITSIYATSKTVCALLDDGTVGFVGDFDTSSKAMPKLHEGEEIVKIVSGTYHYTALTSEGRVFSWGSNTLGQCKVPDDAQGASDIFGGAFQSYAVDSNHELMGKWGLKGYLFGTDNYGANVALRIIQGGKMTMTIGAIAVIISTIIGIIIGCISGYFGGKVDMFLMRFTDIFLALPSMLLMVVLNTILRPGLFTLIAVLSLFSWAQVARITRAETMSVKERDYVTAARNLGAGSFRIAVEHIVPNIMGPVIVAASLGIANAILMESSLSFLGLGVQIPRASWGSMLQSAQGHILDAPRLAVFPGVLILCTVLSFNLLGDVLRTALEPKIVK